MTYHPADDIGGRPTSARDLANLFVGNLLGEGMTRFVYAHAMDPTLVIKYEPRGDDFQNCLEWQVWKAVAEKKDMRRWFAPCVAISANGLFLLQKRVKPLPKDKYPKKIPAWFGDTKYLNFGLYEKRFVACDYGLPSLARLMHFQRRLTKAQWWGEEPKVNG